MEYSPIRLRQIVGHLTGRPAAERIICERMWDVSDLLWQLWTRKVAYVTVPRLPVVMQQHHASGQETETGLQWDRTMRSRTPASPTNTTPEE